MSAPAAAVTASNALSAIQTHLGIRLDGARLQAGQVLAQALLGPAEPEELDLRDAREWAALVTDLLDLATTRLVGRPQVRVFNPERTGNGWESDHTVVQVVNDDMPFLVDSVGMALAASGLATHLLFHPVLSASRDGAGHLAGLGQGDLAESVMHIEVDRIGEPGRLVALRESIERALADVRAAVADWRAMRERMRALAEDLAAEPVPLQLDEREEVRDFLRWMADDHFTFLGYREYEVVPGDGDELLRAVPGTGLGVMRGDEAGVVPRSVRSLAAHDAEKPGAMRAIIITKTNARATVHRPGYMDYVGVLRFDEQGRAIGERRFIGLFTSGAYMRRPGDVPLVRTKVEQVMQRSGLRSASHSGKALKHILETLPRDELFQCTAEEAARDHPRHPRPAGASAFATVPAQGPLRALLLGARLHSPRPLQHLGARAHRGPAAAGSGG